MTTRKSRDEMLAMPPQALRAYVAAGGDWTDGARPVHRPPGEAPESLPVDDIDPDDAEKMITTSVRLPLSMISKLADAAGRDREGRSGIIRQAVEEWFAKHGSAA